MATENIDIIVRENGARVVKRRLEEIGEVAQRSVRGLRLLQNALFVIGGAGLISAIGRMVDTVANFQNRLSLLTTESNEAVAVQKELFEVARRSRTEFDTVSQVFTRTALAVKALGVSQQETIHFTESLMQASILSGASVRETNAALIQMSQALASNRFSGDEFRSVSEQLPFIIDVIGDSLGVTRGEVRQLGMDGKLTAEVILKAFREAREEINEKFARTIPTLSQSFTVFHNRMIEVIGGLDQMTGISAALARAVISVADSLDIVVAAVIAAGTAFAGWKLGAVISSILAWAAAHRQAAAAVASGNATLLTATGIEKAKAASALQAAQAENARAAAVVRSMQVDLASLNAQRAALLEQQASITLDSRRRMARDALTGRFIAYNAAVSQNIKTNAALQRTETMLLNTKRSLTAAMTAQTAAQTALTAAQSRAGAANAATSGIVARLSSMFPTLTAVVRGVGSAFSGLWRIILMNPIGAIIALVAAAVAALIFFSDKISVTSDGFVTLKDVGIAVFEIISEAISGVGQLLIDIFGPSLTWVSDKFGDLWDDVNSGVDWVVSSMKSYINFTLGLWVGLFKSVVLVWDNFPGAIEAMLKSVVDLFLSAIEVVVNAWQAPFRFIAFGLSYINEEAAAGLNNFLNDFKLELPKTEFSDAAKKFSTDFQEAWTKSLSSDYIGDAWGAVLTRARDVAERRLAARTADLTKKDDSTLPPGGDKGKGKTFEQIVRELTLENELLRVNSAEREKMRAILQVEEQLKRSLTKTERELVRAILDENEVLTEAASLYDELNDPVYKYELRLKAINELLESGRIKQEEFNGAMLGARLAFLESQTDIASGLERGILKVIEKTTDAATQMEEIITSAFDGMASSIADLVVDGEADFSSLIRSINKMIVQLVVSQAFQQLFGGYTGQHQGGNIFGGLFKSFTGAFGLPGFQSGGSFSVGANTGIAPIPNGGNDNRLVAFRAQDGEQVTITPRGQQAGGSGQQTIIHFNITTPDVQGFRNSESQLASRAARLLSRAGRNS